MAVLPLLNPYGFDYLPYLWHALRMERARITEWGPLWQRSQPAFILSVYGLSLLAVAYAAWKRGLASLPGLPMVLITALLALQHIRHGSIYAVVWLCLAPAFLRGTRFGHGLRRAWQKAPQLATGLALLFGAAGYVSAVQQRFWELKIPTAEAIGPLVYPVGAVDYLARTEFHGHVMSPFRAGSYISWKLHPAVKVSFDGRYEAAYPPGALEENFDFYAGHDAWRETLTRYDTHLVLVPRGDAVEGLLERLEAEDGSWRRVYHDDGFALFARADVATELPHEDRGGTAIVAEFP